MAPKKPSTKAAKALKPKTPKVAKLARVKGPKRVVLGAERPMEIVNYKSPTKVY